MKLSKVDIDNMAKALSDKLLASPGLKDAKKIVNQVKKNLAAEYKRRKNLQFSADLIEFVHCGERGDFDFLDFLWFQMTLDLT